jgi:hypothetical protein
LSVRLVGVLTHVGGPLRNRSLLCVRSRVQFEIAQVPHFDGEPVDGLLAPRSVRVLAVDAKKPHEVTAAQAGGSQRRTMQATDDSA